MPNLLPDIPDHIAANMLKHERTKLETKRQQLITEITQRQHQIDKIDKRLKEIQSGQQALEEHQGHAHH